MNTQRNNIMKTTLVNQYAPCWETLKIICLTETDQRLPDCSNFILTTMYLNGK